MCINTYIHCIYIVYAHISSPYNNLIFNEPMITKNLRGNLKKIYSVIKLFWTCMWCNCPMWINAPGFKEAILSQIWGSTILILKWYVFLFTHLFIYLWFLVKYQILMEKCFGSRTCLVRSQIMADSCNLDGAPSNILTWALPISFNLNVNIDVCCW